MKQIVVTIEIDEKQITELNTTVERELGWLEESGIRVIEIEE